MKTEILQQATLKRREARDQDEAPQGQVTDRWDEKTLDLRVNLQTIEYRVDQIIHRVDLDKRKNAGENLELAISTQIAEGMTLIDENTPAAAKVKVSKTIS